MSNKVQKQSYIKRTIASVAETKYWDTAGDLDSTTIPVTNMGSVYDLSLIPQNNSNKGRVGDRVTLTNVEVKLSFTLPLINMETTPPTTPIDDYIFRIIVFIWCDETVPTVDDILDTSLSTTNQGNVLSFYNFDKKVKWISLVDETHNASYGRNKTDTGGVTINGVDRTSTSMWYDKDLRNKDIRIDFINGTTQGLYKVYMLLIDNSFIDDNQDATWRTTYKTRILYKDF